jgi:16S rRNA (guanine1207-N2)-methyltransferase
MSHYFSEKQESEFNPYKIKVNACGLSFELYSASGIFSKDQLDVGSRLLIEKAQIEDNNSVLDFGCGYGAVGIAIAKMKKINLTMSDVNERALQLSKMNCKLNRIHGEIVKSNIFENLQGKKFDAILLNPPQTAGKEICFRMIQESKEHLNQNGTLQLVARKKKGGETLSKKMEEIFGNVLVLGKERGFFVWMSKSD